MPMHDISNSLKLNCMKTEEAVKMVYCLLTKSYITILLSIIIIVLFKIYFSI